MKKYPVTYKGNKYEVRWEEGIEGNRIVIYEVIEGIKFKERVIFKRFKTYKCVCSINEETIDEVIHMSKNDPSYYIEEIKKLFEFWERKQKYNREAEKIKANKLKALDEWDGVIE